MAFEMKNAGRDENTRMDHLTKKLEVCQVFKVYTHNIPQDFGWQVCDVIIQDAVPLSGSTVSPDGPAVRLRVPVLQHHIGNCSGTPWAPRVGDSVLVGFYQNDRPVIIGTLPPQFERPVCRSSANPDGDTGAYEWNGGDFTGGYYDWRMKFTQWLHVPRRYVTDANGKQWPTTFYLHPDGKDKLRPVCFNYLDKTRDFFVCWECKKGKAAPDCNLCTSNEDGPDYLECETETTGDYPAMNAWVKMLSTDYEGEDDLPRRFKFHWPCGSLFCVDSDGNSDAEGRIWLEAQNGHDHRAHIHYRAETEQVGANLSLRSDITAAAHIELHGVNDTKKGRIWLSNEDQGNYIDIKEDGDIDIVAKTECKVYIYGPAEVHIKSDTKITLDAPLTHVTGNMQIDGFCTHDGCSCGS